MEAVLSRLKHLTDNELRQEFLSAGLKCGPITGTTRGTFERKLARKLLESQASEVGETETDRPSSDEARGGTNNSSSSSTTTSSSVVDVVTCEGSQKSGECDSICTQEQKTSPPSGFGSPQGGEENRAEKNQSSLPKAPTHYYGVCPPLDSPGREDTVHVYTDQKKALDAVLKMKGARFKVFACREDAEKFATAASEGSSPLRTQGSETRETSNSVTHSALNVEKPANEFKSPHTQDLTGKFRSAVEKGDEETFCQLVWENPRYLIGSADNPTIVQVGCRYNVLHVAAKENRPQMVQRVLETLENPEFMRLMYPEDQESMLWDRMHYIVDLYLNMPDKQNNETPLHFACKFGCPEVVNVLCSHPAIDKEHRNKYKKKPADVICERNKNKAKETKISEYLEDRFYVPLLRAADNTLQPVIGSPWSPSQGPLSDSTLGHHHHHEGVGTPRDPTMTLTAFAGPLTASKADEFHKLWKTPPRHRAKYFHGILKSDPERGAERVGRELAHERGYPWSEYWEFLDSFADLSVQEGLDILEAYLQCKSCSPTHWDSDEKKKTTTGVNNRDYATLSSKSCSVVAICNTTANEADKEDASLHRHKSDTSLTQAKDTPTSEHSLSGSSSAPVRNLLSKFDSVSTPGSSVSTNNKKVGVKKEAEKQGSASLRSMRDLGQSDSGIEGLDQSESGLACSNQSKSEEEEGLDLSNPGFWGSWWQMKRRTPDQVDGPDQSSTTSSAEYQTADEDSGDGDEVAVDTTCLGNRRTGPSTGSTCSSYKSVQSSGYLDTSSDHSQIFVGDSPTSLDNEVLSAMEGIQIDPQKYPSITQWRSAVEAYPAKLRQR
ncbi:ankyrin repeat and LEM domain-containing protein 2 [Engraulis encrasicolus]|uniref:ankyrin repeat and LEM domain-containing protein 2 n=1 Tax=Engraulis encrasicolus TaxID=184585 RepID=UPI002FD0A502